MWEAEGRALSDLLETGLERKRKLQDVVCCRDGDETGGLEREKGERVKV